MVLASSSRVLRAAAARAQQLQVSEDALADCPAVGFPALELDQAQTETLEQEVAVRFRVVQQIALLQLVLVLASPLVAAVAAVAWAPRVEVSEEALADPPAPWFLALALEQPLAVSPEEEVALRFRAVY